MRLRGVVMGAVGIVLAASAYLYFRLRLNDVRWPAQLPRPRDLHARERRMP